jgi:GT2 family glycosyltransferase
MQTASEGVSARVSVIVPHYHDLLALDLCLSALVEQAYPHTFEIIVADNASPEGEAAVAETIAGRAMLILVPARGAGPARNGGVAASSGDLLAFTDCDCVPEADWLSRGLAALDRGDLVGGRMSVLVQDPASPRPAEAFEQVFAFDNERYVREMGFTVTANLFCRRETFDKVGGFCTGASEDLEWCQRAGAAGYKLVYEPLAVVGHPARRTWAELQTKWRRLSAETFALNAQRPMGSLRWLVRSLLLPVSAIAHTPRVLLSPALGSWHQRLGALGVLYRLRFWRLGNALGLLATRGRQ